MNTFVYEYEGKTYINLTNRCSNNCDFCIRNNHDGVADNYLWLDREPAAKEVIDCLEKRNISGEAVFCGFGEPLFALDVMLEVAAYLKSRKVKTRLNTNGQADLICGKGTAQRMKGLIDKVNISLNASNARKYNEICKCAYGEKAFNAMLDFVRECKIYIPEVVLSVVDTVGQAEIDACRALADSLGVKLRIRNYIS